MSIDVSSGETYRLKTPLTSSDTVTLQPGSLLIANQLSFITPASDILLDPASGSEPPGALEIKHVAPVLNTDFYSSGLLVLNFADGTTTQLNTYGTFNDGSVHPFQTPSGAFFLANANVVPNNAHSVPTSFFI